MALPAVSLLSSPIIRMAGFMSSTPSIPAPMSSSAIHAVSVQVPEYRQKRNARSMVINVSTIEAPVVEETKECSLPTWAEFEIGRAPIFWKTMNGLPPTSGEMLTIFYNPAASNLSPNDDFGIAFNGGFNQPLMCSAPRSMTRKNRGKADPPFYVVKVRIPKYAMHIIFSFTNGTDLDGTYKLQFEAPKQWKNKPITFFNEGLAAELSKEGACEKAIFPDSHVVITRCAMIGHLSAEGGDRCNLDLVKGCTDPSSPNFDPLADVDDGSCALDLEPEA